jgi:hypothetical protein
VTVMARHFISVSCMQDLAALFLGQWNITYNLTRFEANGELVALAFWLDQKINEMGKPSPYDENNVTIETVTALLKLTDVTTEVLAALN